jgi:hypothetical protein
MMTLATVLLRWSKENCPKDDWEKMEATDGLGPHSTPLTHAASHSGNTTLPDVLNPTNSTNNELGPVWFRAEFGKLNPWTP